MNLRANTDMDVGVNTDTNHHGVTADMNSGLIKNTDINPRMKKLT